MKSFNQYLKDKQGGIFDIFIWMFVAFVGIILFMVFSYTFNLFTEKALTINFNVGNTTFNSIMSNSLGATNTAQVNWLPILMFTIIMTLGFGIAIYNFFVKSHPLFFFIYIIIIGIAFIISVYLSNAYEFFINQTPVLSDTALRFSASNFILMNLPIFTIVFGFFGALILFIGIIRDEGAGGGVI